MTSEPSELSRRQMLAGAGAILSTSVLPITAVTRSPVTTPVEWSQEMKSAFPLMETLSSLLKSFGWFQFLPSILEPLGERVPRRSADSEWSKLDKVSNFPEDYWTYERRLSVAWDFNICRAENNLKSCENLDKITKYYSNLIEVLKGISLDDKFNMYKRIYEIENSEKKLVRFDKNINVGAPNIFSRMMSDAIHATLEKDIGLLYTVNQQRSQVKKAFTLPLSDGCLDYLAREGNLGKLKSVLTDYPELFPSENLDLFRRVLHDLQCNGRQTISFDNMRLVGPTKNEWKFAIRDVDYRLGLSELHTVLTASLNYSMKPQI